MKYTIINNLTGITLATYKAKTADQALDFMSREAGYKSYFHLQLIAPEKKENIVIIEG